MKPERRTTRTTNNPGLVDLPDARRPSSQVTAEKLKKKEATAEKAKKKREQEERIARVEKEIRKAQKEAQPSKNPGVRTKKAFPAPETDTAGKAKGIKTSSAALQPPRPGLKRKADDLEILGREGKTQPTKMAKITASGSGPGRKGPIKPQGLAIGGVRPTKINTVIEDFTYPDEITESEEEEDDLEYSDTATTSLVEIKPAEGSEASSQGSKTGSRPGVNSLPDNIRRTFARELMPAVLKTFARSSRPWNKLSVEKIQRCMNEVHPGIDYVVVKGDAVESSAKSRISTFRHHIGTTAILAVQNFFKIKFPTAEGAEQCVKAPKKGRFGSPKRVEKYVKLAMVYHGEIPFMYTTFKPTKVPAPINKEKGGYKVTRAGFLCNQPIIETMLLYYGERGIKDFAPTASHPGENPIGVLALVCTAIERALLMHSTGYFIEDKRPFSEKNWVHRTKVHQKLLELVSDSQWNKFFKKLSGAEDIEEKMKPYSKPNQTWSDNPNDYFIVGSDPSEEVVAETEGEDHHIVGSDVESDPPEEVTETEEEPEDIVEEDAPENIETEEELEDAPEDIEEEEDEDEMEGVDKDETEEEDEDEVKEEGADEMDGVEEETVDETEEEE